jgi:hypothetical protein
MSVIRWMAFTACYQLSAVSRQQAKTLVTGRPLTAES